MSAGGAARHHLRVHVPYASIPTSVRRIRTWLLSLPYPSPPPEPLYPPCLDPRLPIRDSGEWGGARRLSGRGGNQRVDMETIRPQVLTVSLHQRVAIGRLRDGRGESCVRDVSIPLARSPPRNLLTPLTVYSPIEGHV
jgi:hypothetical protein